MQGKCDIDPLDDVYLYQHSHYAIYVNHPAWHIVTKLIDPGHEVLFDEK